MTIKLLIYYITLVAQMVKNPPALSETWVLSLVWEDPLEKRMVTHSSILARRIPWTEKPGRLYSRESQKSRTRLSNFHFNINKTFYFIGKCSNFFLLSWDILALLSYFSFIWKLKQNQKRNPRKTNLNIT